MAEFARQPNSQLTMTIMRVVLDTSLIVAALRSDVGARRVVLRWLALRRFQMAASPALFLEYEQVLKRPEHSLAPEIVDGLLLEFASILFPVQIWYSWRPQLIDPDDEMVLEAAINGSADAIVTHNKKDFEPATTRFNIEVWSPAEFLDILRNIGVD